MGCCKKGGVETAYILLSTFVCASALTEPETLDGCNSARNRRPSLHLLCGVKAPNVFGR